MNVCSYTRDIEQAFARTLFRIERLIPMELSLNTKAMPALFSNVSKATRQLLQPFFQAPTSEANVQAFIMPMDLVLERLHQHYVSQEALTLTYEYYDKAGKIQLGERRVYVTGLLSNGHFRFMACDSGLDFLLDSQQILRVK